jgi:hypothetical protein
MNKLKAIYVILNSLEGNKQIELDQELNKEEAIQVIKMMVKEELVTLKTTKLYVNGKPDDLYKYDNIEITMKGLQYRKDNSKTAKTFKAIKNVSDIIH